MPVDVFVAYVDTYIGKQLLRQLEASPHLFTVYGCTWSAEAAQELISQAALKQQQQQQSLFHPDGSPISTISPLSSSRDHGSQATPGAAKTDPSSTLSFEGKAGDALSGSPPDGSGVAASLSNTTSPGVSQGTRELLPEALTTAAAGAASLSGNGAEGKHGGVAAAATSPVHFFSRHDASAVRSALSSCEWIVVEQRQSQEVLDMLACVQQSLFDRPKKFVLLSSFMTWFATPPLSQPGGWGTGNEEDAAAAAEAEAAAAIAAFDGLGDGGNGGDEAEVGGEKEGDVGSDINAPYPLPPETTSDVDEEMDDVGRAGAPMDDEAAEDDGAETDAEGSGKETLTEDQYNRRVPHVKYYNWRDAEKAVAAAHHAKGLPLDTFVIFAGLPYGEGEELLEPFFRQAWCGVDGAEKPTKTDKKPRGSLPIYGDGSQRVPLIHVRDLATFTRKLLHRPASTLPSRYIFATDGARLTWRAVMETINHSFGDQCALVPVAPAEFPLHSHVEQFVVDLRVERGTMAALVKEMSVDANEGDVRVDASGGATTAANGSGGEGLWVAEGGLRRHAEKVSLEFCRERGVTPLRIVVQGPPLAGKRYLATRLAAFYRLPCFSMDDVVGAYKACLEGKKARMEAYRKQLLDKEAARRQAIRKRRIFNAFRSGKPITAAAGAEHGGGAADEAIATPETVDPRKPSSSRRSHNSRNGTLAGSGGGSVAVVPVKAEPANEPDPALFALTDAEMTDVEEFVRERFDSSARVARWREEVGEMERVLLMRRRPSIAPSSLALQASGEDPTSAGTGPMKKRAVAAAKPKKLTKEQQRKKDEEELLLAKEALKDAPFQDRALAIMLRWRLAHADCRTQGYILHGFPQTVAQARLAFGSEPIAAPRTEEEALNPGPAATQQQQRQQQENEADEDAEADPLAGLSSEPSDEHRLPDYVLVLKAPDNFLLDRLAAVAERRQKEVAPASTLSAADASTSQGLGEATLQATTRPTTAKANTDALQQFHERLGTFKQEFVHAAYSLLSYWECAVTESGNVTAGGRRPEVHVLTVHDREPLVPPPPPASAYAPTPLCETERVARSLIGPAHYFGKTPLEVHREEVRKQRRVQEMREAERQREQAALQQDAAAYDAEEQLREAVEESLLAAKRADLAALESRKAPLRAYLMESVIPLVSKGLVEVAAVRPENPLEFLSEWLMRHNPNSDVFLDI